MKKLRLYLDTSVINFLFAEDAPDFRRATLEFFDDYTAFYELYVSDVVWLEISREPNEEHRQRLVAAIAHYGIQTLPKDRDPEVSRMATRYIEEGALPSSKIGDAMHVAYATVHQLDVLVSWNFRHLANVGRESRILVINLSEGYRNPLRLTSPLELSHE